MSKFDELMLELHNQALKLAFEEAEKQLLQEKNFRALEKLKQLEERGANGETAA